MNCFGICFRLSYLFHFMKKPGGFISAPGLMVNLELTSFIRAYPQVCVRPGHIISPGEKHSTTPTHAGS